MLTRHALTRRADEDGVDTVVVERDYVLAHVVAQLHRAKPEDGGRLVFKGGTALRFIHIAGYRYSADLDFTVLDGAAEPAVAALNAVIDAAREHSGMTHLEIVPGDPPQIAYIGPLAAGKPRTIKLDVAGDEYVESVEQGTVVAGLWQDLPEPMPFNVYPIDEITAEKLRCIIQRVQCRDLYDLYRLVDDLGVRLADIRPLFEHKAETKGLDPGSFAARFEDRAERYKRSWDAEMAVHLAAPPRFGDVIRVVRKHMRAAELLA